MQVFFFIEPVEILHIELVEIWERKFFLHLVLGVVILMPMKKCKKCGYVDLSKQEKQVLGLLPATSATVAGERGWTRQHAYDILVSLETLGLARRLGQVKGRGGILFDRVRKKKVWKLNSNPDARSYEEVEILTKNSGEGKR